MTASLSVDVESTLWKLKWNVRKNISVCWADSWLASHSHDGHILCITKKTKWRAKGKEELLAWFTESLFGFEMEAYTQWVLLTLIADDKFHLVGGKNIFVVFLKLYFTILIQEYIADFRGIHLPLIKSINDQTIFGSLGKIPPTALLVQIFKKDKLPSQALQTSTTEGLECWFLQLFMS